MNLLWYECAGGLRRDIHHFEGAREHVKRGAGTSGRAFLKDSVRLAVDFSLTGKNQGFPPPPVSKPCRSDKPKIDLPGAGAWKGVAAVDLTDAIARRASVRRYRASTLSLDAVSYLLWATQGVRRVVCPDTVLRTVPSAGCRHAFETYLCVLGVAGLAPGIYRYLAVEHRLCRESRMERHDLREHLVDAALGQEFVARAPVTFVWTAVPARMEWRYGAAAYKSIALDAGHVCQNLYLACAAVGAGTCAVSTYHQEIADGLVGVDGEDEFVVYLAPVGRVAAPKRS
jgi:SagB-type dehydrogenase family enzyme